MTVRLTVLRMAITSPVPAFVSLWAVTVYQPLPAVVCILAWLAWLTWFVPLSIALRRRHARMRAARQREVADAAWRADLARANAGTYHQ